jgi:GTP cyclohydrolase II
MPGRDFEAEVSVLPMIQDSLIPKGQQQPKKIKRRDTELDPLILAAAFASGPHVTRHHHSHDLFPAVGDPRAEGAWDWTKWVGQDASSVKQDPKRRTYHSQQAPRRQRLRALGLPADPEPQVEIVTSPTELKSPSLSAGPSISSKAVPDERACYVLTIKCGASSQRPHANV